MRGRGGHWIWVLALVALCPSVYADLSQVDAQLEKSRKAYLEHFLDFIKDQNVHGKVKTFNGAKAEPGPQKSRLNADDGNNFRSNLTYHDFSFETPDQEQSANGQPGKKYVLASFISTHGSLGDSSLLEKKTYENHKKFSKKLEAQEEKKQDQEKGIKYKSIFKITTKDAEKDPNAPSGNTQEKDIKKTERREIRDEVKKEIEEVGKNAFESVERAAKGKEFENNPDVLPNSTLLAEAAYRAQEAWWNSTLANLAQGQIARGVEPKGFRAGKPRLSQEAPSCEAWASRAMEDAKAEGAKPNEIQALQQELDKMVKKCKELAKAKFDTVNPTFSEKGKGDKVEAGKLEEENPENRDLRNQLEVLNNVRIKASDLKSNWKYQEKELKSEVAVDYQDGESVNEQMDMSEQIDSYNQQLQQAAEGAKEANAKLPKNYQTDPQKILGYQIKGGNAMEITKRAAKKEYEDYSEAEEVAPAQNYEELLEKVK